jgi:hypothetical protein
MFHDMFVSGLRPKMKHGLQSKNSSLIPSFALMKPKRFLFQIMDPDPGLEETEEWAIEVRDARSTDGLATLWLDTKAKHRFLPLAYQGHRKGERGGLQKRDPVCIKRSRESSTLWRVCLFWKNPGRNSSRNCLLPLWIQRI